MTRRGSGMALVVLTAGSIALLAAPAQAAHGSDFPGFAFRCSDFRSQAAAQRYLEGRPGDPDGLDRDNDGRACENYDYGPSSEKDGRDNPDTPRGGVQAGAGGMAGPVSPALPAAGVVLGTALVGAGVMAARRRATAKEVGPSCPPCWG